MIDIGVFSFKKAVAPDGPVSRVTYNKLEGMYQASARLKDELTFGLRSNYSYYDSVDGNGFAISPYLAVRKAISESLERWAFYSSIASNAPIIRVDRTTSGFAAYPELFPYLVKHHAHEEAVERWSLHAWNKGYLSNSEIRKRENTNYIILNTPFKNMSCVIVWQKLAFGFCYGFAAAKRLDFAIEKASTEMDRNVRVLRKNNSLVTSVTYEKRLLYFSTEEGHLAFKDRLHFNCAASFPEHSRLIHAEAIGPWTRYARVWRTLYGPENIYMDDLQKVDYFLF